LPPPIAGFRVYRPRSDSSGPHINSPQSAKGHAGPLPVERTT
jgi:hypothetical protein